MYTGWRCGWDGIGVEVRVGVVVGVGVEIRAGVGVEVGIRVGGVGGRRGLRIGFYSGLVRATGVGSRVGCVIIGGVG